MKKIELEAIIAERINEARRQQVFEKARSLAEKRGRAYESVPNTDAYGITDYFDTAWRIDFNGVSIDYKSDCYDGRRVTVKFNSARVFHGKAKYDKYHNEHMAPLISCYVPGEWADRVDEYYKNPGEVEARLREELEIELKAIERRLWEKSPAASDKEMEEAEKNFGIKGGKRK